MNHAKNISANGQTSDHRNPVTTAPTVGRVRKLDETTKRCRRTPQGQTQGRPTCDVANAFLTVQFYPRLQEPEIGENYQSSKVEREFYKSLSMISKKLGITVLDCRGLPFPYNVAESLKHFKEQLKTHGEDWKEIRLVNDGTSTFFAREDRYNTGSTLYYIPVMPLYTILHKRKTAKSSKLLMSVYAYVYQVLAVPYYRNEDSYLHSMYDMLENSYAEEDEDDQLNEESSLEFSDAELIGDYIKQLIADKKQLKSFYTLLNTFEPKNDFDNDVHRIASSFYQLYQHYPNVRIDRKYFPLQYREVTDEYDRPITMDNYVSFCASIKGNLFETLCDFVNNDLQECTEVDEPTRFLPFDNRQIKNNNFDFESRVFDSIDDLIRLWQEHNF